MMLVILNKDEKRFNPVSKSILNTHIPAQIADVLVIKDEKKFYVVKNRFGSIGEISKPRLLFYWTMYVILGDPYLQKAFSK